MLDDKENACVRRVTGCDGDPFPPKSKKSSSAKIKYSRGEDTMDGSNLRYVPAMERDVLLAAIKSEASRPSQAS